MGVHFSDLNPSSATASKLIIFTMLESETAPSSTLDSIGLDHLKHKCLPADPSDSVDQQCDVRLAAPRRVTGRDGRVYTEIMHYSSNRPPADYWAYGYRYELQSTSKKNKPIVWLCKDCLNGRAHSVVAHTINNSEHIRNHLLDKHTIATGKKETPKKANNIANMLANMPKNHIHEEMADADKKAIRKPRFAAALVAVICCAHLAFAIVENWTFQAFVATLTDHAIELLPTSHSTVKEWVMASFKERRTKIRACLHHSKSRVHLSFDLWSSPNGYALAGVVAHFISNKGQSQAVLLGLRRVEGSHTGDNIAECVLSVLKDYGLEPRHLGCFVLDNATNNDTCLQVMADAFRWPREEAIRRRLRCMGHIINLCAQAFLFGIEMDVFDATLKAMENEIETGEVQLWELRGPVGKLHTVVLHIRKNPQRREAFKNGNENFGPSGLIPRRDNKTRWNSAYDMIKQAIKLRERIEFYCFNHSEERVGDQGLTSAQILTSEDWYVLVQLTACLEAFKSATMKLQGAAKDAQFGYMWESIPWFESLSRSLKEMQDTHPLETTFKTTLIQELGIPDNDPIWRPGDDPAVEFVTEGVNQAFAKLKKYYDLTNQSVWWYAGLVMNPTVKWAYLEHAYRKEPRWLATFQKRLRDLWRKQYKPDNSNARNTSALLGQKRKFDESDFHDDLYDFEKEKATLSVLTDEYDIYCQEAPVPRPTPAMEQGVDKDKKQEAYNRQLRGFIINWWLNNSTRFPNLSKLAFDALSIPAMSAECERTFSAVKRTISDDRASLEPDTIEALECLRHWLQNPLVE